VLSSRATQLTLSSINYGSKVSFLLFLEYIIFFVFFIFRKTEKKEKKCIWYSGKNECPNADAIAPRRGAFLCSMEGDEIGQ